MTEPYEKIREQYEQARGRWRMASIPRTNPFDGLLRYATTPHVSRRSHTPPGLKTERARQLLRELGPLSAAEICAKVDFPNSGLVYSAFKRDIQEGRISFDGVQGGKYRWIGHRIPGQKNTDGDLAGVPGSEGGPVNG